MAVDQKILRKLRELRIGPRGSFEDEVVSCISAVCVKRDGVHEWYWQGEDLPEEPCSVVGVSLFFYAGEWCPTDDTSWLWREGDDATLLAWAEIYKELIDTPI